MSELFLSVVVPCFNEEERIRPTLEKIVSFLRRYNSSSEVIVVDDGSFDQTSQVAEEKLKGFPHRVLREMHNQGKGHAVRRGIMEAEGQYVLFTDADLSTPIEEVVAFVQRLKNGFDIVIGSRALPDSRVEVHQNFIRETMGKVFNRLARLFTFKEIRDSQCGFKCFSRNAAKELFGAQKIMGFTFDAEILYLAQKRGYRIAEIPVTWRNSPKSRVHIFKDSLRMLLDLPRIRWMHR